MSLRTPQEKSLVLFAEYLESEIGKEVLARMKVDREGVSAIEEATREYTHAVSDLSRFQDFERTFPAYTFALATGVGKTTVKNILKESLVDIDYYLIQ